MHSVSGIPIKQIDAAFLTGRAVSFFVGLWCNWTARRSPKLQISVQVRTDLLWLFSVIGNTSGSEHIRLSTGSDHIRLSTGYDPETSGSIPARAAHGLLV